MQWSKDDLQGVYFICSSAITIGGSILFYIIEIIYKDWSLIISASSSILNIIIGIIPLGLSINGKFFSNKYKFLFLGISLCIGIIGLVPTIVIGIMYINNSNTIIMVLVAVKTVKSAVSAQNNPSMIVITIQMIINHANVRFLEYCPGGDLRHLINKMINKKQKISVENAWNLIGQISYVVYQLHKNSIIHSDIKPENILFTKDFQVKLSDFGMARKLQDGEQKQKATGGTISYMAPELIPLMKAFIGIKDKEADSWNKQPMQNQASDIWSIGTIFYELLALKHPFIQEDVDDIQIPDLIHRISKDDPPDLPSNYPDKMKSMIMMMLIKDPNLRIKAEEIMKIPEIVQTMQKRGRMKLFL
ncbi:MAG: putative NEK protein kinase [Streblomastix strix]|uniref:non-specific serine/threonine protein kinase n=1 Tax=Streblomastix strix TaxID=222440 RepID=A0A5J4WMH2_9EUKA|nr:MAG: putative NEK protein kinase [Streblomastix strix]